MREANAHPTNAQQRILAERTRQIYLLARFAQPLGVGAATMLAIALWMSGGPVLLGLWAAMQWAVLGWLARVGLAYRRAGSNLRRSPHWEHRLATSNAVLGLLWAALALFMLPRGLVFETVVVISLAGAATGCLATLSISALAFHAYVAPTLIGLAIACLQRPGVDHLTLGLLSLLYLVFLALVRRTLAAQFVSRVLTQMRNEELVAQLQSAHSALHKSLAEHQLLFDLTSVGIAEIRERRIVRSNAQLEAMLGHDAGSLLGQPVDILLAGGAGEDDLSQLRETLARGQIVQRDVAIPRRDGSLLWVSLTSRAIDPAAAESGVIAVFSDISDRREREATMHRLAHEDALTGLPNRRLMEDRLRQALLRSHRHQHCVALLLIDLDGFKTINDSHGHEAGDQVLATVARRLLDCVRASDTVARLGGDEFVVLLDQPMRPEDAELVAVKLIGAASLPMSFGAHRLQVGASIGIGIAPRHGLDGALLLHCADQAMYLAKQAGRGTWRVHVKPEAVAAESPRAAGDVRTS